MHDRSVRVVLAEDSLLLREGLVRLLDEAGAEVVAAVGDGPSLVAAAVEHRPDVAVVDVRMPPSFTDEGLRAALELRAKVPTIAVLVLSQYVEESYADDLLSAGGGVGYLLKDRVEPARGSLRRAASGWSRAAPCSIPRWSSALFSKRRRRDPLAELSPREREVLGLMAEGRTNTAIGRQLVVSRGRGGEAHLVHLHQARPAALRRRPPPRDGRAGLVPSKVMSC